MIEHIYIVEKHNTLITINFTQGYNLDRVTNSRGPPRDQHWSGLSTLDARGSECTQDPEEEAGTLCGAQRRATEAGGGDWLKFQVGNDQCQ